MKRTVVLFVIALCALVFASAAETKEEPVKSLHYYSKDSTYMLVVDFAGYAGLRNHHVNLNGLSAGKAKRRLDGLRKETIMASHARLYFLGSGDPDPVWEHRFEDDYGVKCAAVADDGKTAVIVGYMASGGDLLRMSAHTRVLNEFGERAEERSFWKSGKEDTEESDTEKSGGSFQNVIGIIEVTGVLDIEYIDNERIRIFLEKFGVMAGECVYNVRTLEVGGEI